MARGQSKILDCRDTVNDRVSKTALLLVHVCYRWKSELKDQVTLVLEWKLNGTYSAVRGSTIFFSLQAPVIHGLNLLSPSRYHYG